MKCVFRFSLQILSEKILILERNERDMTKNVYRSSCKVRYSCPILIKLEIFGQIFEKYSNVTFNENPSRGDPSCSMRTGKRADMTKLIITFRNSAIASKNRKSVSEAASKTE
jgi:hypothetical protein